MTARFTRRFPAGCECENRMTAAERTPDFTGFTAIAQREDVCVNEPESAALSKLPSLSHTLYGFGVKYVKRTRQPRPVLRFRVSHPPVNRRERFTPEVAA